MQAKIETLKAKNANEEEYLVYPRTLVKCVVDENGNNIENIMKDFVATECGDTYATIESVNDIIDGTTPVENAKTLDGHEAEYFAPAQFIRDNSMWYALTKGFDLNEAFGRYRTIDAETIASLLNIPPDLGSTAVEISVEWNPFTSNNSYGLQVLKARKGTATKLYMRAKYNTTWTEWDSNAFTSDLANYLPKTGGEVTGTFRAKAGSEYPLRAENQNSNNSYTAYYGTNSGWLGSLGFSDYKPMYRNTSGEGKEILHTGNMASHVLPLDGGGTVYKLGRKVMSVKNTDGSSVSIGYESNSGVLGELGVSGSGAFFINKSGTTNYIHHDGNSAKVVVATTEIVEGATATESNGTIVFSK